MKKIMCMTILIMFLISASAATFADESENDLDGAVEYNQISMANENNTNGTMVNETEDPLDNETEEQIEIMNYSLGSEIRLLQLEKSITNNQLTGEMTIDFLQGLGYNTSNLETILDELRLVLEEVQEADPDANNSVETFVFLKNDARNLTKQFRDELRGIVKSSDYKQLKQQIKGNISELQSYNEKIKNRIKQFNRNQIYRLYGIIGKGNNSFVNQYLNGSISLSQVKLQINKLVNMKTNEKKKEIFSHMVREHIQNQANITNLANQIKGNFSEKKQEKLELRLNKANETGNEKLIEKIQLRIQNEGKNANNKNKDNSDNIYDSGNSSNSNGKSNSDKNGKGNGKGK